MPYSGFFVPNHHIEMFEPLRNNILKPGCISRSPKKRNKAKPKKLSFFFEGEIFSIVTNKRNITIERYLIKSGDRGRQLQVMKSDYRRLLTGMESFGVEIFVAGHFQGDLETCYQAIRKVLPGRSPYKYQGLTVQKVEMMCKGGGTFELRREDMKKGMCRFLSEDTEFLEHNNLYEPSGEHKRQLIGDDIINLVRGNFDNDRFNLCMLTTRSNLNVTVTTPSITTSDLRFVTNGTQHNGLPKGLLAWSFVGGLFLLGGFSFLTGRCFYRRWKKKGTNRNKLNRQSSLFNQRSGRRGNRVERQQEDNIALGNVNEVATQEQESTDYEEIIEGAVGGGTPPAPPPRPQETIPPSLPVKKMRRQRQQPQLSQQESVLPPVSFSYS